MFSLSARSIYGLTAVIELSTKYETGTVQIKDIAAAHDIPQHYLEQLLVILKKAGIVDSQRGAQGGYLLARRPADITVSEVLGILDGPLEVVQEKYRSGSLDFYWKTIEDGIGKILSTTLEDLVRMRDDLAGHIMYNI